MKTQHSKIWDADNTMVRGQFIVLKRLSEKMKGLKSMTSISTLTNQKIQSKLNSK